MGDPRDPRRGTSHKGAVIPLDEGAAERLRRRTSFDDVATTHAEAPEDERAPSSLARTVVARAPEPPPPLAADVTSTPRAVPDLAAARSARLAPVADRAAPALSSSALSPVLAEPPRTEVAQKAAALVEKFERDLGALVLGRAAPRTVRLTSLEGESTDGGKRARQSLVLAAEGAAPLVLGFVDTGRMEVKLRDYKSVRTMHQARTGAAWDVLPGEYAALVVRIHTLCEGAGLAVAEEVVGEPSPGMRPRAGLARWTWVAAGLLVVVVGAVAAALAR